MALLSQALHLGYLLSPHSAFQGHAAHTARWPAMLSPNGSSDTCISDGVFHIPMPCFHGALPDTLHDHLAGAYERTESGEHVALAERNTPAFWRAGVPGGGGYATAADLTTFYQMLLNLGGLNGTRLLSPRTVQYVTRNYTGERLDERFGMPMHRGLGVHVRGTTPMIRGLGSTASSSTFGHGGAGTLYSSAAPETGVSFTYLSNSQMDEP